MAANQYVLLSYNGKKIFTSGIDEANRISRFMIHFGAMNVSISRLSFLEVKSLL